MTTLIIVLIGVAVIAVFIVLTARKPNTFRIERSALIKATPQKVFGYLNDFHLWSLWSPWEKLDPQMKRDFGGEGSGKGAVYTWDGNNKAGAGRMEILEADPDARLLIQLDFQRPMVARNTTEFVLTSTDGGSRLTWAMFGPSAFMHKLMSTFFNIDKVVGGDFEKGLAAIKAEAER